MTRIYIEAIGLVAPGMTGWKEGRAVLRCESPYVDRELERYKPSFLPPNERRRATSLVRLAFHACEDAIEQIPTRDLSQMGSVFCSSGGDHQIIDQICRVVTEPNPMVSPTQFHNSVHNSALGYWGIATKSRKPSTSLATGKYTFAAGLMEAFTMVVTEQLNTLFVCYETFPPEPLCYESDITKSFASAYVLAKEKTADSIASIEIKAGTLSEKKETLCANKALETLRVSSAASLALPVLEKLANQEEGNVIMQLNAKQQLAINIKPCY